MSSPSPFVSQISQQSKKRGFPGSTSSALETSEQPSKRRSRCIKPKEIPFSGVVDIIDLDKYEEEDFDEIKILSTDEAKGIIKKLDNRFKSFDTVEDYSDHYFAKEGSSKQPTKSWAKKVQDEWRILEKDLPDTIFVRVYESRMDLLRAVIIGAEGTPYHDGLFFFDVFFPENYPNVPPKVHYHSHGLRINPNLYACGKVCLSLLNTWAGGHKEMWDPKLSTMLQVLVSIQGLILNAKPYFNEPVFASSGKTKHGQEASMGYTENTLILSLKTMVYTINKPPKYFGEFVEGHFRKRGGDILLKCKAYSDGAQVGSLVKGGIQDVDETDQGCSQQFRANLESYIQTVLNAFAKVRVKDCEKFGNLAKPPAISAKRKPTKHH